MIVQLTAKVAIQKAIVVEIITTNGIILRIMSNRKLVIQTKIFQEEKKMIILTGIIIKKIIECPDLQDDVKDLLHVEEIEIVVFLLLGDIVTEAYHQFQEEIEILHPFEDIEMIAYLLRDEGRGAQKKSLNIQRGNLLCAVFRHLHIHITKRKMFAPVIEMNLRQGVIFLVQKNVMMLGIIPHEIIIMKIQAYHQDIIDTMKMIDLLHMTNYHTDVSKNAIILVLKLIGFVRSDHRQKKVIITKIGGGGEGMILVIVN